MALLIVIPAKAGGPLFQTLTSFWIPAFAGMTTFYGTKRDKFLLI